MRCSWPTAAFPHNHSEHAFEADGSRGLDVLDIREVSYRAIATIHNSEQKEESRCALPPRRVQQEVGVVRAGIEDRGIAGSGHRSYLQSLSFWINFAGVSRSEEHLVYHSPCALSHSCGEKGCGIT